MSFDWTDAAISGLRKCVDAGWSAGRAAAHIGDHFVGAPSRNAIIGKALRLKLQWQNAQGHRRRVQKPAAARRPRKPPVEAVAPAAPVESPRIILPPPNSKPVDLMGLTNATRRWPVTEGSPFMFCGALEADMKEGVVYCPYHAAAAIGRAYTRQERFEFRKGRG